MYVARRYILPEGAAIMCRSEAARDSMAGDKHQSISSGLDSERAARIPLTGRVLLVENRRDTRVATALLLSRLGLQVTTAETGREALEIAILADQVGYEFHLILMNIDMPVMDGLEATVLFRYAEYDGPIIAISEGSIDGLESICADAGCSGVLLEPLDPDDLYDLLRSHLDVATVAQAHAA
jgi:CheY-like chemotaxis protein